MPREPILITENEGEKFFRASRGLIAATRLYAAAFCSLPPPTSNIFRRLWSDVVSHNFANSKPPTLSENKLLWGVVDVN